MLQISSKVKFSYFVPFLLLQQTFYFEGPT
jgi:hypothetical protein